MKRIILRTATHHLVAAFHAPLIDLFIAGPAKSPPEIVFWGSRVFTFATMIGDSLTYSEAFAFALAEGATAIPLSASEMAKIPEVEPRTLFNG